MKIIFNSARCTGCKSCEIVCSAYHMGEFNPARSRIQVTNEALFAESKINVCRCCKSPACVKACTYGACKKNMDSGVITIDYEACVGCYSCVEACPFHANFI